MNWNIKEIDQITFEITYYFLIFACILSFISIFIVKNSKMRIILGIEVIITGFAGFIYYNILKNVMNKYKESNSNIKLSGRLDEIDVLRYADWPITTPLMLISLSLILSFNSGIKHSIIGTIVIVILDWIMLYFGYLGYQKILDKRIANILGFIPFVLIFIILYMIYIKPKNIFINNLLFISYFIIWALYGIFYLVDEKIMNILYNILCLIAKPFIAICIAIDFLAT